VFLSGTKHRETPHQSQERYALLRLVQDLS
jgi:hypothetical protein